jgi:hypothetical protein
MLRADAPSEPTTGAIRSSSVDAVSEPSLPPPPPLAAPEGYVGYATSNWTPGLRRVRGLSIAIVAVLALAVFGSLLTLGTIGNVKDASEDFLADRINGEEFDQELGVAGIGGLVSSATTVAVAVLSVIWLYRIMSNLRALGRATFWAPLFGIFGWLLPPFLFIIPLLILIEAWKASDPQVPPGSDQWRHGQQPVLVWVWFLLYGVLRTATSFLAGSPLEQFSRERETIAERFVDDSGGIVIQLVVEILSAIAWALVVWNLTKRHTRLSGEATLR